MRWDLILAEIGRATREKLALNPGRARSGLIIMGRAQARALDAERLGGERPNLTHRAARDVDKTVDEAIAADAEARLRQMRSEEAGARAS